MQPSTTISTVGEIRRLRESLAESSNRSLAIATPIFAAGVTAALIFVAIIVKFIMPNLRRHVPESQYHPSTTRAASSSGQRRREVVVTIPVQIYGAEPPPSSSSSADTTSYEVETCVICLGEFEKGERVSVLPRCKHMFHNDCIRQWVPEKSMNCPMCRVPTADRVGRSAGRSGRVAAEMAGVENGSLSALLTMGFAGTMAISSITGSGL